jgi:hypothetical protein
LGTYPWIGGAVLSVLGGFFFLHNAGLVTAGRWWALILLIPAVLVAGTAWAQYQAGGGRLTPAAGGALAASLLLTVLAAIFLLDLPWRTAWPVFLLIPGIAMVLRRSGWGRADDSRPGRTEDDLR